MKNALTSTSNRLPLSPLSKTIWYIKYPIQSRLSIKENPIFFGNNPFRYFLTIHRVTPAMNMQRNISALSNNLTAHQSAILFLNTFLFPSANCQTLSVDQVHLRIFLICNGTITNQE